MGLLTPCFVPGEGFLYTIIVPGGGFLLPSSRVPGVCPGGGMVLDEIDTCIRSIDKLNDVDQNSPTFGSSIKSQVLDLETLPIFHPLKKVK